MARLEFRMPDVGEGLAEAEVLKWLVKVGERVAENDPVAEVETDKAVVTMPAPATGTMAELTVSEGERVKVGSLLFVMDLDGAATSTTAGAPEKEVEAVVSRAGPAPRGTGQAGEGASARVLAAPVVRKLAEAKGIDLESVPGSGPRGRITREDVEGFVQKRDEPLSASAAAAPEEPGKQVERIPLRGLRRRIAEAMTLSARTIPHVCGFHEIDAAPLTNLRVRFRPRAEAVSVRLTYLPFIVRATVLALEQHPYLNASIDEKELVISLKKRFNVGIAIATEEGLVVPVLHGADRLGILELARRIEALGLAARERRLQPADMRGGTFTITNVGQAGGWFGTSIIRHPEAAILGVGRISKRPVVRDGQIVVGSVLPISLTFDHRILDGDGALAFVQSLRDQLERPEQLLLGEPQW